METESPKSLYEQLKEMKPHHAINFVYEQILQKPEDESILMANLTKYMFEKRPSEKEVSIAFQANTAKRAEIITENAGQLFKFGPIMDKVGFGNMSKADAEEMQRLAQRTIKIDAVFKTAMGVLDSYSLAEFGKMPSTIYEEHLSESIDKLLG